MSLDNRSVRVDMSSVEITSETVQIEMQARVKRLAWPCEPGESIKSCIRRVARKTGLTFGQVRHLWYADWRVIPTHISDRLRQAAQDHEADINLQIERQRRRLNELYALINHSADPEFYSKAIAQAVGRTDELE